MGVLRINLGSAEAPNWVDIAGGIQLVGGSPYLLDIAPTDAHADNDEFTGEEVSDAWELVTNGADVTISIENSSLVLKVNSLANIPFIYLRKEIPVDLLDFEIRARSWFDGRTGNDFGHSGVTVWTPDGNAWRSAFLQFGLVQTGACFYACNGTTGNFVGSYLDIRGAYSRGYTGLKFTDSSKELKGFVSFSGEKLGYLHKATLTANPTHYGLSMGPSNDILGLETYIGLDFFRVITP